MKPVEILQAALPFVSEAQKTLNTYRYRAQHKTMAVSAGVITRLFHFLMDPKYPQPPLKAIEVLDKKLTALLTQDLNNAEQGYYPKDLLFHLPVFDFAKVLPKLAFDYPRAIYRKHFNRYKDIPSNVRSQLYPDYYLRNFHWQTDGWFSTHSAELYEAQVEILFGGTANVMRRMAIPPLVDALKAQPAPRVLDVACGTGTFLSQLAPALPNAKFYGLDLSPYYVTEARHKLSHLNDVSLVAENAEKMPFQDHYFDAVSSVFLFHELPTAARRNVLCEIRRVLKPGAKLVISDAAQLAGNEEIAYFLKWFPQFYHEPFFTSYLKENLEDLLEECGYTVLESKNHYVSKVVVATAAEKTDDETNTRKTKRKTS